MCVYGSSYFRRLLGFLFSFFDVKQVIGLVLVFVFKGGMGETHLVEGRDLEDWKF